MTTIASLIVTKDVLREVVGHCRDGYPNEVCGFIIGSPKTRVGRRVVQMINVHPDPSRSYRMANDDVVAAYAAADAAGEEVVAVYHSHPTRPPVMSTGPDSDVDNAIDNTVAYLIVSMRDRTRPTARAWRVDMPFIGVREATEIPLRPTASDDPMGPTPPSLPWALSPGNYVEITYRRARGEGEITMMATVTGGDTETVMLHPRLKSGVSSLPLERILRVQVVTESDQAREVRREAIACLRHAAASLSSGDVALVEQLIAVPSAAFPATIETDVRG